MGKAFEGFGSRASLSQNANVVRTIVTSGQKGAPIAQLATKNCVDKFLGTYDTFLFDCDGVLWDNDHVTPFPGVEDALKKLQSLNKLVLFVTNNSMVSRQQLLRKLQHHGINTEIDNIFCNAYASGMYLKNTLRADGKVYLVGSKGMKEEMDILDIETFGFGPDPDAPSYNTNDLLEMTFEDNVSAVLVGLDEHFNYNKIYKAASYLQNPECHFVATNLVEKGFNIAANRRMPITGALVKAIADVAQREPIVVGKPHNIMFDLIQQQYPDCDKSRAVFVGDNLKADMAFAKSVGIDSALVLTGASGIGSIQDFPHLSPEWVLESVKDILL